MAVAFARTMTDCRRALDLEALLTWVIRDQMADRTDSALHPMEAIAHYGLLQGLPVGTGVYRTGISGDGCATIANRNKVGADIDGGGTIRGLPPRVHPDAELVAELVERLPDWQRRLVRHHARMGNRPDWLALVQPMIAKRRPGDSRGRYRHVVETVEWQSVPTRSGIAQSYLRQGRSLFDPHGRRRIVEEERGFTFRTLGDGGRWVRVDWCPLEPAHSDADIIEANTDYAGWHAGMAALLGWIDGRGLRDHVVTGFAAPAAPWEYSP